MVLLSTGASDDFSKQGIYDLAGNVFEFTLEHANLISRALVESSCALRGGVYDNDGSTYSAADRYSDGTTIYYYGIGFRLSLY